MGENCAIGIHRITMRQMQLAAVVAVVLVTACAAHSDCDVLHSTTQRACDVFGFGSIGCQGLKRDLQERCDRLEPAVVPQTRQLGDIAEEEEDQKSNDRQGRRRRRKQSKSTTATPPTKTTATLMLPT